MSISRVLSTKYQLYQRPLLCVPMRMLEERFCKPLVESSILSPGTNVIKDLLVFFPFQAFRFSFGLTSGLTEWLGSHKPTNGRRCVAPPWSATAGAHRCALGLAWSNMQGINALESPRALVRAGRSIL